MTMATFELIVITCTWTSTWASYLFVGICSQSLTLQIILIVQDNFSSNNYFVGLYEIIITRTHAKLITWNYKICFKYIASISPFPYTSTHEIIVVLVKPTSIQICTDNIYYVIQTSSAPIWNIYIRAAFPSIQLHWTLVEDQLWLL